MRIAALIAILAGILTVIGAVGRTVYGMATAFTAAQTDPSAPPPSFSINTMLAFITVGVILIVVGVVLLLAGNRSDSRF